MASHFRLIAIGTALSVVLAASWHERAAGQAPAGLTKATVGRDVPRTPDGKPDLQGMWNAATITPLERPDQFKSLVISEDDAARLERAELGVSEQRAQPSRGDRNAPPVGGNVGGYNFFWIDRGTQVVRINGQRRSSLIVDPADGKIPAMTAAAQKRNAGARGSVVRPTSDAAENDAFAGQGAFDDVELRPLAERCLLSFGSGSGPPALPILYNNFKQIVQTPAHVVIVNEMVHDARIIPFNRPHAPSQVRRWMGDSVARWDGDTLVVETTNFTSKTRFRGSSPSLKVTERFTRVDLNTILYQFTIDDPETWTRPWSGEYNWLATSDPMYEYACHEGNYALTGILKGERLLDAERAAGSGQR